MIDHSVFAFTEKGGCIVVDSQHPLHLQEIDTPGSSLVSIELTGCENYSLWSRSMKICLFCKGNEALLMAKVPKISLI